MIKLTTTKAPNYNMNPIPTMNEIRDLALELRSYYLSRTKQGKDINGVRFRPYSDAYRMLKSKIMVTRGSPDHVNLMLHGKMLRSITVKSRPKQSEIYFSDAESAEIAYRHQEGIGVPQREFFGVNQRDNDRFIKAFMDKVFKRMTAEWKR